MKSILVISEQPQVFQAIQACFRDDGYEVDKAGSKKHALDLLIKKRYDLIFIDLATLGEESLDENYKEALQPLWQIYPSLEIVVMAPPHLIRNAVKAVKSGARDYLTYPIDPVEVKYISENINDSIIMKSELDYLRSHFWQLDSLEFVQTKSAAMQNVFDKIRLVAPTKSTVLLNGETGTGKSLMAKLIHQHSNRREAQFISAHCGAIPDTLLESELFGHEKGAFTGAVRRKLGKFEIAKGGTIFLDEIGTITPSAQIKLLQILQDGTFQRVGGEETLEANTRVIAATNTDLKKMCNDGQFRKDLYYRLNVFPIEIPPLRERIADIPYLVDLILKRMTKFYPKKIQALHPQVIDAFQSYEWPGNIRELENLMERAYILEASTTLTPKCFPDDLFDFKAGRAILALNSALTLSEVRQRGIEDIERNYVKEILSRHKGKINESARNAGITPRQLNKLMNKYGIRKEEFKGKNDLQ